MSVIISYLGLQKLSDQLLELLKGSERWFKRYDDGNSNIVRDQIRFQQVLREISQDLEYSDITGFEFLLEASEKVIRSSVILKPAPSKSPFKTIHQEERKSDRTMSFPLPLFLQCFSSYSLREFYSARTGKD